jgi:hypothetical protein
MTYEKWLMGKKYWVTYCGKNNYGDIQLFIESDENIIDSSDTVYQKLEKDFLNNEYLGIEAVEILTDEEY